MTAREKKLRQLFKDNFNCYTDTNSKGLMIQNQEAITEGKFVELVSKFYKNKRYNQPLTERELEQDAVKHYKEKNVSTKYWVDIVSYKLVWKRCYNYYFNREK